VDTPRELERPKRVLRARMPFAGAVTRTFGVLALRALVGAAAGAGVAAAALLVDARVGWSLPFDAERVQDLLLTLTGAAITIAVFALWMRSIVVGLVTGTFPARSVTGYLDDRFQGAMTGWMIAAIAVLVTVLLGSPPTDEGTVAPTATVLALTTVVAALLGILLAIRQAALQLDTSDLLHQLARRALTVLEETASLDDEAPSDTSWEAERALDARALGWVADIDRRRLAEQLPPGTAARLLVRPGQLVAPGETVLELDRTVDEDTADRLRRTVRIDRRRYTGSDLDATLDELIDTVRRAAGQDAPTAGEALRYLEVVLTRLVGRQLPTGHVQLGDRLLLDCRRPTAADHVERAARQIRASAAAESDISEAAEAVLARLADAAEAAGDQESADAARTAGTGRSRAPADGRPTDGPT
jgi:uncharacterized membrane protein